ncbi:hypothetical protein BDW72DRAFT_196742 [Aspergillus terricola var. indicus]
MGKVHGSLARAGKVKSATPKVGYSLLYDINHSFAMLDGKEVFVGDLLSVGEAVEPQEKKKLPKGRAMKRLKYTRRFVNVTMTGGKRKMNPNPGN